MLARGVQYKSTKSGEVLTSLGDYASRMKEGQKGIYYIAAESDELAANSPFVEALARKDQEVRFRSCCGPAPVLSCFGFSPPSPSPSNMPAPA